MLFKIVSGCVCKSKYYVFLRNSEAEINVRFKTGSVFFETDKKGFNTTFWWL